MNIYKSMKHRELLTTQIVIHHKREQPILMPHVILFEDILNIPMLP